MKKLALAAAIAALSANASAGYVAIKVTTGSNVESYLWDINGSLLDGSAFFEAMPTALAAAVSNADSVVWDAFDYVLDETPSVTTDVRGVATNIKGTESTLQTGLQLTNAIVASYNFTVIEQPAFVDGVAGPSVAGQGSFYNSSLHGESLASGVGVFGYEATTPLGQAVELWEVVKATGDRGSKRGFVGADEAGLTSRQVGISALVTSNLTSDGLFVAPIPVPAAVWLMGSALAGLGVVRRRAA